MRQRVSVFWILSTARFRRRESGIDPTVSTNIASQEHAPSVYPDAHLAYTLDADATLAYLQELQTILHAILHILNGSVECVALSQRTSSNGDPDIVQPGLGSAGVVLQRYHCIPDRIRLDFEIADQAVVPHRIASGLESVVQGNGDSGRELDTMRQATNAATDDSSHVDICVLFSYGGKKN